MCRASEHHWGDTELVREIVGYAGVYSVHQRSESTDPRWYRPSVDKAGQPTMLDAVEETIRIGEQTGATVIWSHAKAMGANYWGSSKAAIRLIARARARGIDVWTDQYPYNSTGGDGATVLIPAGPSVTTLTPEHAAGPERRLCRCLAPDHGRSGQTEKGPWRYHPRNGAARGPKTWSFSSTRQEFHRRV
jgi:hypothetical protein